MQIKQQNNNQYDSFSLPHKNIKTMTSINTYHHSRLGSEKDFMNQIVHSAGQMAKQQQSFLSKGSLKGQKKIEYVPFERKVIEFSDRTYKQLVPTTKKVVEYEQRKVVQNIPREVLKKQFIAVEKITRYYKQVKPEKRVEMVPVERKVKKIEYLPYQKKVYHYYPSQLRGEDKIGLLNGGKFDEKIRVQSASSQVKDSVELNNVSEEQRNRFCNKLTGSKYVYSYGNIDMRSA